MAVSKVAYDGHTLIDLTQDTVVESDVADGKWFHKSNGERVQGTSGKVIVQGSDSSAFLIRPTAGETLAPLDCDRKSVLKKLGNTAGVNQLVKNGDFSSGTTNWAANNTAFSTIAASGGVLTQTIPGGSSVNAYRYGIQQVLSGITPEHTHISVITVEPSTPTTFKIELGGGYATLTPTVSGKTTLFIVSKVANYNTNILIYPFSVVDSVTAPAMTIKYYFVRTSDLDIWYGSHSEIPSDLLSHPENWGRYYAGSLAYNAGTLESADGTAMTSIGRNVWDEVTETGTIDTSTGQNSSNSTMLRCKNYIPVIPNTAYYFRTVSNGAVIYYYDASYNYIGIHSGFSVNAPFTTPTNAHFMRFRLSSDYGTAYKSDITISLYYSGESGYDQYYPYTVLAEVDTGSEVLRSAGAVADEKTPDGTITRRVGVVDLGTLNWTYVSAYGCFYVPTAPTPTPKNNFVCICSKYSYGGAYSNLNDKQVGFIYNNTVAIKDSTYGTDAAAFKTAMSGIYLYYELATPTTEQGTAFTGLQKVDGHGIEMVTGGTTGIPVPFTAQYLKTINAAPTDTIVITENGSHDVSMYAGALVNVSGGGTPSLQSKTVNLDSNAPSTVYPGTGYNGLSSVSFNTTGINAANIKAGTSVCGVAGTYAALTYDEQVVTPPIGVSTPVTFALGWKPDVLVFDWSAADGDDPSIIYYYRKALTADGSIESGNDTVTFTSTGYTVMMSGTYWNDSPERFGDMTITAIKLS